jgi:proteasome lid subunit RPN8/RPN11
MARSQKQHLVVPAEIYDAMFAHCIKGSPLARFGILAGTESLVSAIYPLRNAAESSVRYESDPSDLRDFSPRQPKPMWDPSLDRPRERDYPDE